jgi:hypothetical protein
MDCNAKSGEKTIKLECYEVHVVVGNDEAWKSIGE